MIGINLLKHQLEENLPLMRGLTLMTSIIPNAQIMYATSPSHVSKLYKLLRDLKIKPTALESNTFS